MKYLYYTRNYSFFIFYFLFLFIPKIKLGADIFIWPFELFMILFIMYFIFTRKKLILEKTLIYPLIFFVYLIFISSYHIAKMHYDLSLAELLRNLKFILYFLSFLMIYSYLYNKYKYYEKTTITYDVLNMFVFFSTLIMCLMLLQIIYHFVVYGVPSISELIWGMSSNQRPYLYTGRYFSLEGLMDIPKGNGNATGILAVLVFFFSLHFYKIFKKKLYLFNSSIAFITLLMSFSRSSLVVFILLLFAFAFLNNKLGRKIKNGLLIIFVSVLLIIFFGDILNYTIISKIDLMINSISSGKLEASAATRVGIWEYIFSGELNYFSLIFGNGFGTSGVQYFTNNQYNQPESLFLSILIWGGMFSSIFILYYINLVKKAYSFKKVDYKLSKFLIYFLIVFALPNIFTGGDLLIDATMHYLFPIFFLLLYTSRKAKIENTTNNS